MPPSVVLNSHVERTSISNNKPVGSSRYRASKCSFEYCCRHILTCFSSGPIESPSAANRKRKSITGSSHASGSKRPRTSSSNVHEDEGHLIRSQLNSHPNTSSIQDLNSKISLGVQKLQEQVVELRRQQAIDRAHFEYSLSAHNDQLENLRRTLDGQGRGRTPSKRTNGLGQRRTKIRIGLIQR